MHLLSYRGPGAAGGVSAALARAWECNLGTSGKWWHLDGEELQATGPAETRPKILAKVPEEIIRGHYRFCNDFLWPIMHDLPQYAHYNSDDYAAYHTFNDTVGWCLLRGRTACDVREYFIQDYQMALVPYALKKAGLASIMFWHIPWPKHVPSKWCQPLKDVARGMLQSEGIGFHTSEYAANFMNFVRQNMPEFATNNVDTIYSAKAASSGHRKLHSTRLVVAPLGIDYDHWSKLGSDQQNALWHPSIMRTPFVLSVDRADYTKGVTNRMQAIDRFFTQHPDWAGRIVFMQICGKTRGGLTAFDKYWHECQQISQSLRDRWATDSWQPLAWIEGSFAPPDLAHAYRSASAMLISAVRDGLNLTAKEYVAAQGPRPGVLVLSTETGAWHELGDHTVSIKPDNIDQMANSIYKSLTMDGHERAWRMALLKDTVRSNTLESWWWNMTSLARPAATAPVRQLRESS